MKKIFAICTLSFFVTDAFADDWRMRKFDMDMDGFVVAEELKAQGCTVKPGLFKNADKNDDGKLSKVITSSSCTSVQPMLWINSVKTPGSDSIVHQSILKPNNNNLVFIYQSVLMYKKALSVIMLSIVS